MAGHQPPGQLHRQAGLAGPGGPADGDEPVLLQQLGELAQLQVAPDEAGQSRRQVVRRAGRRWGGLQRTVLGEDRLLQPLQRRGRVDAQLLGQHRAGLLVDAQRVRLPPGAVQRQHQLRPQPLAQRVAGDERVELADEQGVAAERQ
ncbi:MAG TPA: hypothetical protein VFL71_22755, partial [Actinomycetes bacterium]|nr:hypothetical protein [Actinomycetes bacterium]